jgi:acyl-coenzyme A synthetase/AMP-(fatty) acid ligase
VPIVHFYGPKEVGYILAKTNVKALVTADRFGHQDFLANLVLLREDLPGLEWVAVVGDRTDASLGPGDIAFADLVSSEPLVEIAAVDPGAPALVAYTSGTTSDPKGVVHSHRTITAEIQQLAAMQANRGGPAMITGAPVGHGIGMLAALLVPVYNRTEIHLIDVWDPGRVLAAMLDDGLSAGQGSTFFLTSLLEVSPANDVAMSSIASRRLAAADTMSASATAAVASRNARARTPPAGARW